VPPLDRNGRLVLAGKAVRAFAFGLGSVVLGLYLVELGLGAPAIGAVLSAALIGTTLLTLGIAVYGDRIGRRRVLALGGALMLVALAIPLVGADPFVLVLIALTGMVAVTSNESSGLQSLDQAILPQTTDDRHRTAAFATYGVTASIATALGALAVGPLTALGSSLGLVGAARFWPAFVAYSAAGAAMVMVARAMDRGAEPASPPPIEDPAAVARRRFGIHKSRHTVARLSILFGLDALGGGLIVQSFLAIWFTAVFGFSVAAVGVLFFAGNLMTAASYPVAAWLASRIGLIRTMVFTHIPASLLLVAMTLVPWAGVAAVLFLARAFVSSMDVPTRQSYTMAVVDPDERTATAGLTSVVRSTAQAAGPLVAASLVTLPLGGLSAPLIACAGLKITYDLALYVLFRRRPAPEEVARPAG
jgi:MFS family permease